MSDIQRCSNCDHPSHEPGEAEAILECRELRAQLDDYHQREAACCPEDVGFEEYIKVLRSTIDSVAAILGWGNTPPRHVLEQEIKILRDRAKSAVGGSVLTDDMKQLMADASYMTGSVAADESQTPEMKMRAERAWQTIKRINSMGIR